MPLGLSLPVIGTVSYGSYTFGAATETVSVRGQPQYDSSNRTVTHVNWEFTLRTILGTTPPTTTDTAIKALRKVLMKQGQVFVYQDKGFSDDFSINTGTMKDVAFGPRPSSFSWKPIASRHAVEVVWSVIVALPECDNAIYERGIREANFRVAYEVDRNGLTRRTFSGHLIIALNQIGRRITDHGDNYREKFVPEMPAGFRRDSQRFEISEDKSRLDVTVVDVEWPNVNVPPVGCTDARLKHYMGNAGPGAFTQQHGSLNATYTIARGFPPAIAVAHFRDVIEDRVLSLNKDADFRPDNIGKDALQKLKPNKHGAVIPIMSSVTEDDAFGVQRIECFLSYAVTTSPTLLFTKGLWKPIPGSNWNLWAKSMKDVLGPRGWAGMGFDGDDDAIIDLCIGGDPHTLKNRQRPPGGRPGKINNLVQDWPKPEPEGSWLSYMVGLRLEPQDRVMRHVPTEPSENRLRTPALLGYDPVSRMVSIPKGKHKSLVQALAASSLFLTFEGFARRAWYDIPVPQLRGAFGRAVVPANDPNINSVELIEDPFQSPIPIQTLRWRLRFLLTDREVDIPAGIDAAPHAGRQKVPPKPTWKPREDIAALVDKLF